VADVTRTRLTKETRRAQILQAARGVFVASGLQGARIAEIAQEAQVNEALIYQHFDSKDELFAAAVVEPLQQIIEDTHEAIVRTRGLPDSYSHVRFLLGVLMESMPLFGVVLFSDRTAGMAFYNDHVAPLMDTMTYSVQQNLRNWSHRDFDPTLVTAIGFGMCWGLAMDATFRGLDVDLDVAAKAVHDMALHGLAIEEPEPRPP
jgi:TetR/AcrR family transcriptional regulator